MVQTGNAVPSSFPRFLLQMSSRLTRGVVRSSREEVALVKALAGRTLKLVQLTFLTRVGLRAPAVIFDTTFAMDLAFMDLKFVPVFLIREVHNLWNLHLGFGAVSFDTFGCCDDATLLALGSIEEERSSAVPSFDSGTSIVKLYFVKLQYEFLIISSTWP